MADFEKCARCGCAKPVEGDCVGCFIDMALDPEAARPAGNSIGLGRVDRYQLLERLGEGGFGVVYLAEQEEPIWRQVALKVIGMGPAGAQARARFEAERQALALMDHPNIAKILDAGTTAAGQPFFVMEYLQGMAITEYCDHWRLSVRKRVELFIQVCQAVQHAHQKGIIHRDLKPSNILVCEQNGEPHAMVIDFGIAKIAQGQELGGQDLTVTWRPFLGTPAYMSPEQAGASRDIDSRSDIYSLGVLLYELLTGQRVLEPSQMGRSTDRIMQAIREDEPLPPSARLDRLDAAQNAGAADRRRVEPASLRRALENDLDWIVMKALEKQRERRYETAAALASDARRHLTNEPVLARPPSAAYKLQKLMGRHRAVVFSAGAVALALVIGSGVATWQYTLAEGARARAVAEQLQAQMEADKSRQVAQFLEDMLAGIDPAVARGRDTGLLREILAKTESRIDAELTNQPEVAAELRNTVGGVYLALGDYNQAEASLQRALARPGSANGPSVSMGESYASLGVVLARKGRYAEAEELQRHALEIYRALGLAESAKAALALGNLGNALWFEDRFAQAERVYREALALSEKLFPHDSEQVARSLGNLGNALAKQGKAAAAEPLFREALTIQTNVLGPDHPVVARSLDNLANSELDLGQLADSERDFRRALALRRKILGPQHPDLAYPLLNLGSLLTREGKCVEAEKLQREALDIREKALGPDHLFVAVSWNGLGDALRDEGKLALAEEAFRHALAIRRQHYLQGHTELVQSLCQLAGVLFQENSLDEAARLYQEAATMQRKLAGAASLDLATVLGGWVDVLEKQQKDLEEETVLQQLLECQRSVGSGPNPGLSLARSGLKAQIKLAAVLTREGTFAETERVLLKGWEEIARYWGKLPVEDQERLREAVAGLEKHEQALGQGQKAADWGRRLDSLH